MLVLVRSVPEVSLLCIKRENESSVDEVLPNNEIGNASNGNSKSAGKVQVDLVSTGGANVLREITKPMYDDDRFTPETLGSDSTPVHFRLLLLIDRPPGATQSGHQCPSICP